MDWKKLTQIFFDNVTDSGGGAGAGSGGEQPSSQQEPNSTSEPAEPPEGYVPQDKVDKIVQQRLKRERSKYESRLDELGFENFDEVAELKKRQKEREKKELEEKEQYKELLEKTRQEKDEQIQKLQQQLEQTRSTHRQTTVERTLVEAAAEADAVAPSQVAGLLDGRVQMDDDGELYPVDDNGQRLTDGQGNELSVQGFVNDFLEDNPHFQRAAEGQGAGGRGSGGGETPSEGFDPNKRNDVRHLQENRDEIIEKMKRGEISG